MTKKYFIELADYNVWANDIVHSWLDKITDEQWKQPVVSSFNSIAETVIHNAGAETVWLDRLNHKEATPSAPADFKGTKKDAQAIWEKSSQGLKSFIEDFDEAKYYTSMKFKRVDGNTYELLYYQVFAHVLNHSTYHRGQLVTMLRQVGFTGMSSTDLSTFYWIKKN